MGCMYVRFFNFDKIPMKYSDETAASIRFNLFPSMAKIALFPCFGEKMPGYGRVLWRFLVSKSLHPFDLSLYF